MKIIKWFLSAKKLAKWSADGIQRAVNGSSCTEQIAKYGEMADRFTEVQKWLTQMLKDGKIDELEKGEIEARLLPLYEKLMEVL